MSLTPEQKQAVSAWVAAGDNLSAVQKKIIEQFKVSMTYMDVRFLVDDLNLQLKDPAPRAYASDVTKGPAPAAAGQAGPSPGPAQAPGKRSFLDKAKERLGLGGQPGNPAGPVEGHAEEPYLDDPGAPPQEGAGPEDFEEPEDAPAAAVRVTVDKVVLIPGAIASGTVSFGDGVTGKWIVDNYGRPALSDVSQPGYRPSPAVAQAFMQELSMALQQRRP